MTGQDQMNIVRKVTEKYAIEKGSIRDDIKEELVVRHIIHDMDLITELSEDVEYRFQHESDILAMDGAH